MSATMKAAVFHQHGGPDQIVIERVLRPIVGPADVLVEVRACALNHMDLLVRRGPADPSRTLPFWGGADVAGLVAEAGPHAGAHRRGERVLVNPALWCGRCEWCARGEESLCAEFKILGDEVPGGEAEFVSVPARNVVPIPDSLSFEEAAAVPLVFQTAWRALIGRARIRPGEEVLIVGASGGVATAAIQIARLAGARVLALTSGGDKAARARELGADLCVDRTAGDWSAEVRRHTRSRGVDVVVENVGTPTWRQSLACLAPGGRLVTYGRTGGRQGEIDIRDLFVRQWQILGSTMASRREFDEVIRLLFDKRLRPVIDRTFPLEEARAAQERLEAGRQFGKIVLTVGR
jgi:NADPH:quinone reductase-like Zn-dependent oxidoreductase